MSCKSLCRGDRNLPRPIIEVLCEGAVIPYYEYRSPAILTDAEWREQLGRPDGPQPPEWTERLFDRR